METFSTETTEVSNQPVTMGKDFMVETPPQACPICPICPICSTAALCAPASTASIPASSDVPFTTEPMGQLREISIECISKNFSYHITLTKQLCGPLLPDHRSKNKIFV